MTSSQSDPPASHGPSSPAVSLCGGAQTEASLDNGWSVHAQINIDLGVDHLALAHALDRSEDAVIWDRYRSARDPDWYLHWLASLAGTYCVERAPRHDASRKTPYWYALMSVAFLLPPEKPGVDSPTGPDLDAVAGILGHLRAWVDDPHKVSVVTACTPYSELSRWSPVTQREYLHALAKEPARPSAPWLGPLGCVPENFPQLAFMHGSLSRWNAFPELPPPGLRAEADWQLRCRLAAHLAYMSHRPVQPHDVLLPSNFAQAVAQGVRMWIAEVLRRQLVDAWQVRPGERDLVTLELNPSEGDTPTVMLPLRLHQIGSAGIDLILADLMKAMGPPVAQELATAAGAVRSH
jgi:hypothetical protein